MMMEVKGFSFFYSLVKAQYKVNVGECLLSVLEINNNEHNAQKKGGQHRHQDCTQIPSCLTASADGYLGSYANQAYLCTNRPIFL